MHSLSVSFFCMCELQTGTCAKRMWCYLLRIYYRKSVRMFVCLYVWIWLFNGKFLQSPWAIFADFLIGMCEIKCIFMICKKFFSNFSNFWEKHKKHTFSAFWENPAVFQRNQTPNQTPNSTANEIALSNFSLDFQFPRFRLVAKRSHKWIKWSHMILWRCEHM